MQRNKHKKGGDATDLVQRIEIKRRVCDIADFLGMWTELETKKKKGKKTKAKTKTAKGKTYNPITGNCQQFAADLFEFLVGHKAEYKHKVQQVKNQVQSPYDRKRYNVNDNNDDNENVVNDDEKQEEVEEEKGVEHLETVNHPKPSRRVDSVAENI